MKSLKNPVFQYLTDLSIDDCEMSVDQACDLGKAILSLTHLNRLSLCHNELTSGGALVIAHAVGRINTFHELKVDGNTIAESIVTQINSLLSKAGKHLGGKFSVGIRF